MPPVHQAGLGQPSYGEMNRLVRNAPLPLVIYQRKDGLEKSSFVPFFSPFVVYGGAIYLPRLPLPRVYSRILRYTTPSASPRPI
jgi:hypothetical protein